MTESQLPFVKSVFHPSDFSPAGEAAFAHALAVALIRETSLTILHAGDAVEEDWARFPAVRTTLERWGLLEPGSPRRAVFEQLSIAVTKVNAKGQPIRATRRFLETFVPPAHSVEFLALVARSTWQTVAIATVGTALAMLIAFPMALVATRTLSVSRLATGRMAPVAAALPAIS